MRSGSGSSIARPDPTCPGHPRTEVLERGIDLDVAGQGIDAATVRPLDVRHPKELPIRLPRIAMGPALSSSVRRSSTGLLADP